MANKQDFVIEDGVLTRYNGPGGEVAIPEGVTEIRESAFLQQKALESVRIPESVQVIRAPRTPISAFAENCQTGAAIGFAELRQKGVEMEEEIQEGYLRYIRTHQQTLYPAAFRHLPLLKLLYEERLLSPADFQALRKEAERQENPGALAILDDTNPAFPPADSTKTFGL